MRKLQAHICCIGRNLKREREIMIIADYISEAAMKAAQKMSRQELEGKVAWHESQDRQMAFNDGDLEQVFELLHQADMDTHEFEDEELATLHIKFLENLNL